MSVAWTDRPTEVANLLNPAFTGAVLRLAVAGYSGQVNQGMPFELAFMVFPFALHAATRARLPRAISTLLHAWLQDNRDVVVQFPERTRSLAPFTREAIIFACQRGVLRIDDQGMLHPGDEKLKKITAYKSISDDIKEALARADFVGRWFALSGSPITILTLLGVRP